MIISHPAALLLGSTLLSKVLANPGPGPGPSPFPWDDEEDQYLQPRADIPDNWVPDGAPARGPDQGLGDYLANVLDGTGNPVNHPSARLAKRGDTVTNPTNTTYTIESADTELQITLVDGHCTYGIKPNQIAGTITDIDGNDVENATISDLIDQLYQIRIANKNDVTARNTQYANFLRTQIQKTHDYWLQLDSDYNLVCKADNGSQDILHDELRKLLALSKFKFYAVLILGVPAVGAIGAALIAWYNHGTSSVEFGWQPFVATMLLIDIILFFSIQMSRLAPTINGADVWGPLALWSWLRKQGEKARQKMRGAGASTSTALSSMGQGLNSGGNSQPAQECANNAQVADPSQLMEEGNALGPGSVPVDTSSFSATANLVAGPDNVCH